MENMKGNSIYLGIMTMVLLGICGHARGQDSSTYTSCISTLLACVGYLNTTGIPPSSCCNPLVNLCNTNKACLCGWLDNTGFTNISITQAMKLPARCSTNGIATDCSDCTILRSPSPPPPPPPSNSGEIAASSAFFEVLPLLALLLLGVVAQV